jgi:hypothetical protein
MSMVEITASSDYARSPEHESWMIPPNAKKYIATAPVATMTIGAAEPTVQEPSPGSDAVTASDNVHQRLWALLADQFQVRDEMTVMEFLDLARQQTELSNSLILAHWRQFLDEGRVELTSRFTLTQA